MYIQYNKWSSFSEYDYELWDSLQLFSLCFKLNATGGIAFWSVNPLFNEYLRTYLIVFAKF
jgi:hypothetical protein